MAEFEEIVPEEYDQNLNVLEFMRRIKHCLVKVALVFPMVFLTLDLIFWPSMRFDTIPISRIWVSVVPIAVSILVFVEAYAETIKKFKYYYCTTFLIYESIWFLSISTYACVVMNLWSTENWSLLLYDPAFKEVVILLYSIVIAFYFCAHWVKNTLVHISLCRYEIFSTKPERTQYDNFPKLEYTLLEKVMGIDCANLYSWTPFVFGIHWLILFLIYEYPYSDLSTGFAMFFFPWPMFYILFMFESKCNIYSRYFMQNTISLKELGQVCILLALYKLFAFRYMESTYPNTILLWMCCLSISRQWFFDMKIYPEKYMNHIINPNPLMHKPASRRG